MRNLVLAAVAALGLASTSNAAVLTLQGVSTNGPSDFTFTYQATLGPDEGVRTGDRFVIFDFLGLIAGSAFSASPDLVASVENSSPGAIVSPGFNDDAGIGNLVFTYTGPSFRTATGPLAPFTFAAIGARSIHGQTDTDAFFTLTTKNNPANERNKPIFTLGSITVPTAAIPEPAAWALMLGGFGLAGTAMRRRDRFARVIA